MAEEASSSVGEVRNVSAWMSAKDSVSLVDSSETSEGVPDNIGPAGSTTRLSP